MAATIVRYACSRCRWNMEHECGDQFAIAAFDRSFALFFGDPPKRFECDSKKIKRTEAKP